MIASPKTSPKLIWNTPQAVLMVAIEAALRGNFITLTGLELRYEYVRLEGHEDTRYC